MYRRKITIDHTMVHETDHTNFPVLIELQDGNLKHRSYGGHVAQKTGGDIGFFDLKGKLRPERLRPEIAEYDPAKGILRAWVNLPMLSHSEDSVFFLSYGASKGETEAPAGTPKPAGTPSPAGGPWAEDYRLVIHANEASPEQRDSSRYGNDGRPNGGPEGEKKGIRIPHSESLAIKEDLTVEAWASIEKPKRDSYQMLVSKWVAAGSVKG